jgi:hypothetical protein
MTHSQKDSKEKECDVCLCTPTENMLLMEIQDICICESCSEAITEVFTEYRKQNSAYLNSETSRILH